MGYPTNIFCLKATFLCRNRCENKTLCMEKLSLVLPDIPPFFPRQYDRCAVIGNSGDLLKTKFGKEIDSYDAIFRENGAPIQVRWSVLWLCFSFEFPLLSTCQCALSNSFFPFVQNYTEYVGSKSTFRLLNRGSAKALDKVAELYGIASIPMLLDLGP